MTMKLKLMIMCGCLAAMMLASCSNSKFSAEINLKGLGNQRVHIIYCGEEGNIVDTWDMAQEDVLQLEGNCASPSMLMIFNSMNVPVMRLVVSGGDNIKVTGKIIENFDLQVEGSDILKQWNDFVVKHKTAYKVKNSQMLNPEIEKFVKANRNSVVSTLLVLYDYQPSDPAQVDKLLKMIDDSAKPEHLLKSYNAMKAKEMKPATEVKNLNLFEHESSDFEAVNIVGDKPSVIFFWDKVMENSKRKAIVEELKMLNKAKVNVIDINIDSDSAAWSHTIANDGDWKHYWVPGSMMNSEVIRLQVKSTPTIIVTNAQGKQQYRGDDGVKARQMLESMTGGE